MSMSDGTTSDAVGEATGLTTGLFRRPSLTDPAVGGKARSLARLAAFGLPVPSAFAIVSAPGAPVLEGQGQGDGPGPPAALATSSDLATLDEARAAVLRAPFSAAFLQGLPLALAELVSREPGEATPGEATFSIRSSSALEDSAEAAAPGVFDSALRVPRAQVGEAVRAVLASALTPAAWVYVLRARKKSHDSHDAPDTRGPLAVLVHQFVAGDAHGAVVCEPAGAEGGQIYVQLDVQDGVLTASARAAIEAAARRVAAQAGPVELEWTAAGETVTFLQLRPFQRGRLAATGTGMSAPVPAEPGWVWDAAHNPAPLTPAQAGLVEWVDARCTLGFRQQVVGGYLFYRTTQAPPVPSGTPRALFDRLESEVTVALAALGPTPRLREALAVYTHGYEGLFGVVQPACRAARAALKDLLQAHAPQAPASWPALVDAGISSAATRRRAAAIAISAAPDVAARTEAIAAYLTAFGDESARWDVAEPTLRERPEALLFMGQTAAMPPDAASSAVRTEGPSGERSALALASSWPQDWPHDRRAEFQVRLAAAREASAVAEDDDALFARLQAAVRAALRALGESLVADGRLIDGDEIFFLPFAVARALDAAAEAPSDLRALAAAGRAAFADAATRPPAPAATPAGAHAVAGQCGAGGRAIGRVLLHPSSTGPGPTGPSVIIAATLLPTELPLLDAAALVVETGTPLGHVAAQARERGIPAIVAAPGARAAFRPGQLVLVDGDRGLVFALDDP